MSKVLHRSLQAKMAVLQGPEWDSSDEEGEDQPENTAQSENSKKAVNTSATKHAGKAGRTEPANLRGTSSNNNDDDDDDETAEDLVLYIGHLPKEMQEQDLREFLRQFGNVINIRVARKLSTGQPKGYAFVRFDNDEVATIAKDTLHGYFLGVGNTQRLVCQLRPAMPGMFFSTDSAIRKRKEELRVARKLREANLANPDKLKAITTKLVSRDAKKRAKLAALGIDYNFPGYAVSSESQEESRPGVPNQPPVRVRGDSVDSQGSIKKTERKRKSSMDSQESVDKKHKRKDKGKRRKSSA